jgi:cysteine-rich repeat protein
MGPPLVVLQNYNANGAVVADETGVISASSEYGDPFDSSWPIVTASDFQFFRRYSLQGVSALLDGEVYRVDPVSAGGLEFEPIPLIANPTLNNVPIAGRFVAWDGTAPLQLSVTLPAGADHFVVTVERNVLDGSSIELIATTITSSSDTATLPPEVFQNGAYYTFGLGYSTSSLSSFVTTDKILLGPQKLSRCGDEVVDPTTGETCDDGNTVSGDGCSATCQTE